MKRNIYSGIPASKYLVCSKCGAEWHHYWGGNKCPSAHGFKPPYKICNGILKEK